MSVPVPGERPSAAIPAPPPGEAPDRHDAREAVHELLDVQAAARQVLETARAATTAAATARADEVTGERLPVLPLATLQETTSGGLRLAPFEEYGITTVGKLLTYAEHELDAIPGVGEATARQALTAARRVADSLRATARVLPDPDHPTERGATLLRELHRLGHLQLELEPAVEGLEPMAGYLAPSAAVLDDHRGRVRWLFTGRRAKDEVRAAASVVAEQLARPDVVAARAALTAAFARSTGAAYRTPTDAELWQDYQRRGAEYATALERADTGVGSTAVAGDRARGGLSAEVAARVDAIALDCRGLRVSLRGYQEFGVKYIVGQGRTILGDEMGLGKTIQALGAMTHLAATEDARHFLVVAPASVAQNWLREVATRTDLRAHLLHGPDRDARLALWQRDGGVAITSYDTLRVLPRPTGPAADGSSFAPAMVVADEAHYVKNPDAERTQATAAWLQAATRALLMSGTPLENRVDELVHLVAMVSPSIGATLGDDDQVALVAMPPEQFRERVAPVYLRRNQDDVLHELPERIEIDEWVELSPTDEAAYVAAVGAGNAMTMRVAATLGAGRPTRSAKLERLEDLLEEYREDGLKVIVFSFFRDVLDAVTAVAGGAYSITGDTPATHRLALVDQFSEQPGFAVMANQIEAGGVGINLQAAAAVILMEPQWKPSTEAQAIARAHRMGQTRRVTVHRLLARDSIDEQLVGILQGKQAVFDAYARDSAVKDATGAATDISEVSLTRLVVEREQQRLGIEPAAAAGSAPSGTASPDAGSTP